MEHQKEADSTTKISKNDLIECPVCGQLSSQPYHNYGAKVCFSCRAFFRRCHQKSKQRPKFVCRNADDACVITVATRRHCQKCRYELCVRVGMRAENVMDESAKRLHFRRYFGPSQRTRKISSSRNLSTKTSRKRSSIGLPIKTVDPFIIELVDRALSNPIPNTFIKDEPLHLPKLAVFGFDNTLSSPKFSASDPLFREELSLSTTSSLSQMASIFEEAVAEHEDQWLLGLIAELERTRRSVDLGDFVLVELVHHVANVHETPEPRRLLAAILQTIYDRFSAFLNNRTKKNEFNNNNNANNEININSNSNDLSPIMWRCVAMELAMLSELEPQMQLVHLACSRQDRLLLGSIINSSCNLRKIDFKAFIGNNNGHESGFEGFLDAITDFLRQQDESTKSVLIPLLLSSSSSVNICSKRVRALLHRRLGPVHSNSWQLIWTDMNNILGNLAAVLEDVIITQCVQDAILLIRTTDNDISALNKPNCSDFFTNL